MSMSTIKTKITISTVILRKPSSYIIRYLKSDAKACEIMEGVDNMLTQMFKDIN